MDKETDEEACVDQESGPDSQLSDAELLECLDEPTDWFVIDQAGHVLTVAISLRHALRRVRMILSGGVAPHLLVRASGGAAVVRFDQLWRIYGRVVEE